MQMPKYYPDKLLEVRPVSNAKKEHLQMIAPMVNLCIEKQMGPFQGRSKLKQYNPQKPKKQGCKLYVLKQVRKVTFSSLKYILVRLMFPLANHLEC